MKIAHLALVVIFCANLFAAQNNYTTMGGGAFRYWAADARPPVLYGVVGQASLVNTSPYRGDSCVQYIIIGDDGRNQDIGYDVPPFATTTMQDGRWFYYRWAMKFNSGFSWGSGSGRKAKSERYVFDTEVSNGHTRGWTGYIYEHGVFIGEAWSSDSVSVPDPIEATVIHFALDTIQDNNWHEYVVGIKKQTHIDSSNGQMWLWVDGNFIDSGSGIKYNSYNTGTAYETFGAGWMSHPYFQIGGTASDGGTMFVDDFSTDSVWNSTKSHLYGITKTNITSSGYRINFSTSATGPSDSIAVKLLDSTSGGSWTRRDSTVSFPTRSTGYIDISGLSSSQKYYIIMTSTITGGISDTTVLDSVTTSGSPTPTPTPIPATNAPTPTPTPNSNRANGKDLLNKSNWAGFYEKRATDSLTSIMLRRGQGWRHDYADFRITVGEGDTILNTHIEDTTADSTLAWVKIKPYANRKFKAWYGNDTATPYDSDIRKIFRYAYDTKRKKADFSGLMYGEKTIYSYKSNENFHRISLIKSKVSNKVIACAAYIDTSSEGFSSSISVVFRSNDSLNQFSSWSGPDTVYDHADSGVYPTAMWNFMKGDTEYVVILGGVYTSNGVSYTFNRYWSMRSTDWGQTWKDTVDVSQYVNTNGWYWMNNEKIFSNGGLYHLSYDANFVRPIFSMDSGLTWQAGRKIRYTNGTGKPSYFGINEADCEEVPGQPGTIIGYARTDNHTDNGGWPMKFISRNYLDTVYESDTKLDSTMFNIKGCPIKIKVSRYDSTLWILTNSTSIYNSTDICSTVVLKNKYTGTPQVRKGYGDFVELDKHGSGLMVYCSNFATSYLFYKQICLTGYSFWNGNDIGKRFVSDYLLLDTISDWASDSLHPCPQPFSIKFNGSYHNPAWVGNNSYYLADHRIQFSRRNATPYLPHYYCGNSDLVEYDTSGSFKIFQGRMDIDSARLIINGVKKLSSAPIDLYKFESQLSYAQGPWPSANVRIKWIVADALTPDSASLLIDTTKKIPTRCKCGGFK